MRESSSSLEIRYWNKDELELRTILKGHKNSVKSLAYDLRSNKLWSGGKDYSIRIWEM
jgi:WD40 repeat protein